MAENASDSTQSKLATFIAQMSEATGLVEDYNADPEKVMSEAGLSEEEMALVRRGDEEEIIAALGGEVFWMPPVKFPRLRFPKRRPPTDPTI